MGIPINANALLKELGFDESASYELPEDLNQLSVSSLRSFIDQTYLQHSADSTALIHVTGPAVSGHSAPLRSIGDFMIHLQAAFDSIGASIEGFKSLGGAIPSALAKRTELSLIASPLPGSVVLEVAPTKPRLEDLYPHGEALFDVEKVIGAKPLADSTFEELSSLMSDLATDTPDQEKFIDHLAELGPRVASNMRALCDAVDKGAIDIDFEWRSPSGDRKKVGVNHTFAKFVSTVIKNTEIDTESVEIEGVLVTITTSAKDHLRIREDSDEGIASEVTLLIGDIPPEQLYGLQTGDRVRVDAERQIFNRVGGGKRKKLVGISIEKLPRLQD